MTGPLLVTGGTLTLTGNNTSYGNVAYDGNNGISGNPTILNGGVLSVGSLSHNLESPTFLLGHYPNQDLCLLQLTAGTLLYTGSGADSTLLSTSVGNATVDVQNSSGNAAFTWSVTGGALYKAGAGTLSLGGHLQNTGLAANVQQGTLVLAKTDGNYAAASISGVSPGATLRIGHSGVQIAGAVSNMNGTFDFNGMNEAFTASSLSGTGTVTNNAASTTSTVTFYGGGTSGFTGAVDNGAGTMALQPGSAKIATTPARRGSRRPHQVEDEPNKSGRCADRGGIPFRGVKV